MSRAHHTRKGIIQHPKDLLHPTPIVYCVCRGLKSVLGPMPWVVTQRGKANPIATSHRKFKDFVFAPVKLPVALGVHKVL